MAFQPVSLSICATCLRVKETQMDKNISLQSKASEETWRKLMHTCKHAKTKVSGPNFASSQSCDPLSCRPTSLEGPQLCAVSALM